MKLSALFSEVSCFKSRQFVSIVRNVTENYIQDVQTKVLRRYVLLTFTYNLKNFSKSQQKQLPAFNKKDGEMPPPQK